MGTSSKYFKQSFLPPASLARGRGQSLKSMGSIRVTTEKRNLIDHTNIMLETMRRKSGLNSAICDRNVIPQKTNVVSPDFEAIEVETSFPYDNHEVMQENMRNKPGKENGKNITSVGSARGSTFVQRISIGKSKAYSVVSSDMNVPTHNKIHRCAEKITLNGKNNDSKNIDYHLNELTQNNNRVPLGLDPMEDDLTLPQDKVEVMQDTQRSKAGFM
ncbi:hypothetical protein RDI58_028990 [Solanum bulbocastanum]|uniref:Uncharacterized protein n=1 Tax=Solanum bulbocastanum TaxID=147425 RepID=A0AAN8STL2_SOLBU